MHSWNVRISSYCCRSTSYFCAGMFPSQNNSTTVISKGIFDRNGNEKSIHKMQRIIKYTTCIPLPKWCLKSYSHNYFSLNHWIVPIFSFTSVWLRYMIFSAKWDIFICNYGLTFQCDHTNSQIRIARNLCFRHLRIYVLNIECYVQNVKWFTM